MPSYLKNKSDREIEELIEATTEERVVEGFANSNMPLIVFGVLFVVFGLLWVFYIYPMLMR
jgi:hypothetical protein